MDNQENSTYIEEKERKTLGEIFSKLLVVVTAIVAIAAVGFIIMVMIRGNDGGNKDVLAPEIITSSTTTTAPSTTLASAVGVKVKGKVYAKAEADILAEPAEDATVIGKLAFGDTIDFVSVDDKGWCTVVYEGKLCYVHRNGLSAKQPVAGDTTSAGDASTTDGASTTQAAQPGDRKVIKLEVKHWTLVVVDKDRQLPAGYEPELAFVAESDCALDKRIASYYDKMYAAALADGIELTPYSGYRSYDIQERNFNSLVDSYLTQGYSQEDAEKAAETEILPPGSSEHNLGFAMDICCADASFKDSPQYEWLKANAGTYGFIERYPEGKQDVTGVIAEPWHWRFIGPKYVEDMNARGAETLEEYLQSYNVKY